MTLRQHEEDGWIIEECEFGTTCEQSIPTYRKRLDRSTLQRKVTWILHLDSDGLHFQSRDKNITERFYRFLDTSHDCSLHHDGTTLSISGWCDVVEPYDRDLYFRNIDYAQDRY